MRELVSVCWRKSDHRVVLHYETGEPDRVLATQELARELANEAGLALASSPKGVVRWVRELEESA